MNQTVRLQRPAAHLDSLDAAVSGAGAVAAELEQQRSNLHLNVMDALGTWEGAAATSFAAAHASGAIQLQRTQQAYEGLHGALSRYNQQAHTAHATIDRAHAQAHGSAMGYRQSAAAAQAQLTGQINDVLHQLQNDLNKAQSDASNAFGDFFSGNFSGAWNDATSAVSDVGNAISDLAHLVELGAQLLGQISSWSLPQIDISVDPIILGAGLITPPSTADAVKQNFSAAGWLLSGATSGIEELISWGASLLQDTMNLIHEAEDAITQAIADAQRLAAEALHGLEDLGDRLVHTLEHDVMDALRFIKDFGEGLWDGTIGGLIPVIEGLAVMAYELSPIRAAIDPSGWEKSVEKYGTDAYRIGDYVVHHPVQFAESIGKALADTKDWKDHPGRALGTITGEVLTVVLTAGAGTAADGAASAGRVADTVTSLRGLTGVTGDSALGTEGGLTAERIFEITDLPKGARPDPSTYLPREYIEQHLAKFDGGATRFMTSTNYDKYGIGQADHTAFVMPREEVDTLIQKTGGDPRAMETALGLPERFLTDNGIVRLDVDHPRNYGLRIPTGNEAGANDLWIPGGELPGGNSEAVIDTSRIAPADVHAQTFTPEVVK